MSLDVEPPAPPTLQTETTVDEYDDVTVSADQDYHREELDAFLQDGAWAEAFEQWAEQTELGPDAYQIATELELLDDFDFFWDDFADRVGYHAPGLPEDWKARNLHPELDAWNTVSAINASLTELGRAVSDHLKAEYVDWDASYEPPDDLPEFD